MYIGNETFSVHNLPTKKKPMFYKSKIDLIINTLLVIIMARGIENEVNDGSDRPSVLVLLVNYF